MSWRDRVERERNYGHKSGSSVTTDCYETVSKHNAPKMLTLIWENGKRLSASYADLKATEFIEGGLKITFSKSTITVKGYNLLLVHTALANHRVTFLKEVEKKSNEVWICGITVCIST